MIAWTPELEQQFLSLIDKHIGALFADTDYVGTADPGSTEASLIAFTKGWFQPPVESVLSIDDQVAAMTQFFPQFKWDAESGAWLGHLRPRETSFYPVRITYTLGHAPRVYVSGLLHHAPYRSSDGALGLYYPPDGSWTPAQLIALTIVPWACEWLFYYDVWMTTGTWFGGGVS